MIMKLICPTCFVELAAGPLALTDPTLAFFRAVAGSHQCPNAIITPPPPPPVSAISPAELAALGVTSE
jgi:hypothetical protein